MGNEATKTILVRKEVYHSYRYSRPFFNTWRLKLEEYEFKIEYVKGKDNPVADSLSRIHTFTKIENPKNKIVLDFFQHFTTWKHTSKTRN